MIETTTLAFFYLGQPVWIIEELGAMKQVDRLRATAVVVRVSDTLPWKLDGYLGPITSS